jgi:hypothetical protein
VFELCDGPTPTDHRITMFLEPAGLDARPVPVDVDVDVRAGDPTRRASRAIPLNNRGPATAGYAPADASGAGRPVSRGAGR